MKHYWNGVLKDYSKHHVGNSLKENYAKFDC